MPQNGIQHEGIAALADAMAANPNLKVRQSSYIEIKIIASYATYSFKLLFLNNNLSLYILLDRYISLSPDIYFEMYLVH